MTTAEGYDTFVQAHWHHQGRQGKKVRLLVAHCTVTDEGKRVAEAIAAAWSSPKSRKASAHAVVDPDSAVGCVHDGDTAFAAAGANNDGWHCEFVGQATQTAAQWVDPASQAILKRAAPLWRERSDEWEIPKKWLTVAEVAAGKSGWCTHDDVSKAYPEVSTGHWDPGLGFPKNLFAGYVIGAPTNPTEDFTMAGKDRLDAQKGVVRATFRDVLKRYPTNETELNNHVLHLELVGYEAYERSVMESAEGAEVLKRERKELGLTP